MFTGMFVLDIITITIVITIIIIIIITIIIIIIIIITIIIITAWSSKRKYEPISNVQCYLTKLWHRLYFTFSLCSMNANFNGIDINIFGTTSKITPPSSFDRHIFIWFRIFHKWNLSLKRNMINSTFRSIPLSWLGRSLRAIWCGPCRSLILSMTGSVSTPFMFLSEPSLPSSSKAVQYVCFIAHMDEMALMWYIPSLTHVPLVLYICVSESGQHCFG